MTANTITLSDGSTVTYRSGAARPWMRVGPRMSGESDTLAGILPQYTFIAADHAACLALEATATDWPVEVEETREAYRFRRYAEDLSLLAYWKSGHKGAWAAAEWLTTKWRITPKDRYELAHQSAALDLLRGAMNEAEREAYDHGCTRDEYLRAVRDVRLRHTTPPMDRVESAAWLAAITDDVRSAA